MMKCLLLVLFGFSCWSTVMITEEKTLPVAIEQKGCFSCNQFRDGVIFCDDFESDAPLADRYFEYDESKGSFTRQKGLGRDGSAGMRVIFEKGQVAAGSLKKSFGRTPDDYIGKHAPLSDKDFKEIYWRVDVKMQEGWTGGGADKLTRATVFTGPGWSQGMIAHLWSAGDLLVMDPASGIDTAGKRKSTRYNDFANLRWLGNKKSKIDLFSDANVGKWYCIVGHARLNTPGKADGVFEFWIDDQLQAGSYNLNWHGNFNADARNYMINAVFFENYWNNGSPVRQERYMDNILISTRPIKCGCE